MLSKPNDWPADPAFREVFRVLSPEHFREALHQNLPVQTDREHGPWTHCRVIEALYDPGKHVRIAYVLSNGEVTGRRAWPDGEVFYARYPVRKPMSRRGIVMTIDGLDVEIYRFPNDRRLRGLRKFASRPSAFAVWQKWLDRDEPGLTLEPDTLRRSLLRYVPEQKWIIHLHAQCKDKNTGELSKRALAVRSADVRDCQAIHERMIEMRRLRKRYADCFRVMKPIAIDTELGLLATRWVWGQPLVEILQTGDPDAVMQRVARGLSALHDMPINNLSMTTASDHLASASRCVADIAAVLPSLKPLLGEVLSILVRCAPDETAFEPCTVHNDFHWNQLRGRPDRLTLLDLERCAIGDPLIDVATFVTQLSTLCWRPDMAISKTAAAAWSDAFFTAWEGVTHSTVDVERMRWYSAVALLTLARGMLRHLRAGWPEQVRRCAEEASRTLSNSTTEVML